MTNSDKLAEVLQVLELAEQRRKYRHKDFFVPYDKQTEFTDLGAIKRERCLFAGNQTGKTEIGAFEVACHLTGEYPDWWLGKRYDRPVKGWAAGVTGLSTRDVVQKKLCGEPGVESAFGTGMIPREAFVEKPSTARGVTDLYDKIIVRHISGGDSVLLLKSYEQDREKWQGDTLDFVWFDEEPPEEIYNEGLARLTEGGMVFLTFTPLHGYTKVVLGFTDNPGPDKGIIYMTLDDVGHFSKEEKAKRIAAMAPHEREARERGLPMRGEGVVFKTPLAQVEEDAIPLRAIPAEWRWLWGIDFGIAHPFAAVLGVWDKDADVIHIVHCFKIKDASYFQHVRMMREYGRIKVAWPQDGNIRDRGNLVPMAKLYKKEGLWMCDTHATFESGSNSTEAGVAEMAERFSTGRLKVAKQLMPWFQEFTNYHRKDGLLVKLNDDLMSATRVMVMAKRFAGPRLPWDGRKSFGAQVAKDVDFDPFNVG